LKSMERMKLNATDLICEDSEHGHGDNFETHTDEGDDV
jgi:hypothetical protein